VPFIVVQKEGNDEHMKKAYMSLSILFDLLNKQLSDEAFIENDEYCICGVRAYDGEQILNSDYVYVRSNENDPSKAVIQHQNGYIVVDAPWNHAINIVMTAMEQFKRYDEQLHYAVASDDPFQKVAEIAYQMLGQPLMITSNIFRVIGIAGADTGIPWEYSKTHRFSPPAYVSYFTHASRFHTYMTGDRPLYKKLPSFCNWKAFLRVNCFYENEAKCRLVISASENEMPGRGFIDMAAYIGTFIEQISPELSSQYFYDKAATDPFVEKNGQPMLCNNPLNSKISNMIGTNEFYLCQITPVANSENYIGLYWIYGQLNNKNINIVPYLYDNSIILLIPCSSDTRTLLQQNLSSMLDEMDYICLISNACSDLKKIHECINQTNRLRTDFPDLPTRFMFYEDHAESCLIREITSKLDLDIWVHKGLKKLIEYDTRKKTDYYQTLCCLAKNQFAQNTAAAELFIHRNSLQYRIEKIEQILDCKLSDANVRFFVRLSILLISAETDSI